MTWRFAIRPPRHGGHRERVVREVDHVLVELRPRVVLRSHVHRTVIVQEVMRERQDAPVALELEIERRRAAERREQRVRGKGAGHEIDEFLRERETAPALHRSRGRRRSSSARTGCSGGSCSRAPPPGAPCPRRTCFPVRDLLPSENHDSTPGSIARKPFFWSRCSRGSDSSDRLLSATNFDAARRHGFFDRRRASRRSARRSSGPASRRTACPSRCEGSADRSRAVRSRHRLVVDRRSRCRTTQVYGQPRLRDHRHELEHRRFLERRRDELPARLRAGQLRGLLRRGSSACRRADAARARGSRRARRLVVGEAEHVVEVARGIFGIAARVRSAEHGDRAARAERAR